jgi:group I intron endonuclease
LAPLTFLFMQFNIPAEHKNASGVYIIRNTVNAKVYVGSAMKFFRQFTMQYSDLNRACHHSVLLQRFATKYGLDMLSFELLELAPAVESKLLACEQKWLDTLRCYLPKQGFNILTLAGSPSGHKMSEEFRRKMSEARKGKTLSEEHRRKIGAAHKGKVVSEETRRKLSEASTGQTISEHTRRRVSEAQKGRTVSEGHRRKISEAQKGKVVSEETRRKL